jgi:hypothetical protein
VPPEKAANHAAVSSDIVETIDRIIGQRPETHPKNEPDEIRQVAKQPHKKSPVGLEKAAGFSHEGHCMAAGAA